VDHESAADSLRVGGAVDLQRRGEWITSRAPLKDWSGDLDSILLLLRDGGGFVALHPELDVRLRSLEPQ